MHFRWNGSRWVLKDGRRPLVPAGTQDKSPKRIAARKVLTTSVRTDIILEADSTCTYCKRQGGFWVDPDDQPWHMDHIVPIERGGSIQLDNVTLACARCNLDKGRRTPEEWKP